jgi:23S rRNA (adenine2503-C2)-methyltransferase
MNLIPLNRIDAVDSGFRPSPPRRVSEFAEALRNRGFPVTVRYSLGGDVAGACGQLVQRRIRGANFAGERTAIGSLPLVEPPTR